MYNDAPIFLLVIIFIDKGIIIFYGCFYWLVIVLSIAKTEINSDLHTYLRQRSNCLCW
jgi:hypothetical protein